MQRGGPASTLACAAFLLLAAAGTSGQEQGRHYRDALGLADARRFTEALETADLETSPVLRAQARVYALYRGRDFLAALSAAEAGLQLAPSQPWLLERAAASALSLQAPEVAEGYLDRLERALEAGAQDAEGMAALLADYRGRAERLIAAGKRRDAALRRARSTATGLLLLTAVLLLVLAQGSGSRLWRRPLASGDGAQ